MEENGLPESDPSEHPESEPSEQPESEPPALPESDPSESHVLPESEPPVLPESDPSEQSESEPPDLRESEPINLSEQVVLVSTDTDTHIRTLKEIIKQLNIKLRTRERDYEVELKKAKRDLRDMLSASHDIHMQSQREKYEEIINEINKNQKCNIEALTKYYEHTQKKYVDAYKDLLEDHAFSQERITILDQSLSVAKEQLDNIQCILLGTPPTKQIQQVITAGRLEQDVKRENDTSNEKLRHLEHQILDQKQMIDNLNRDIHAKEAVISNVMFQMNYYKDLKNQEETEKKKLQDENQILLQKFDTMQDRYREQFCKYEKLLKKANQETELHKRETARVLDYCGKFPPSPAARRLIRKSNSTSDIGTVLTTTNITLLKRQPQTPKTMSQESLSSDILSVISPAAFQSEAHTVNSVRVSPTSSNSVSVLSTVSKNKNDVTCITISSTTSATIEASKTSVKSDNVEASKTSVKSDNVEASKTSVKSDNVEASKTSVKSDNVQKSTESSTSSSSCIPSSSSSFDDPRKSKTSVNIESTETSQSRSSDADTNKRPRGRPRKKRSAKK